jgi:aryl-alcohol dehydrogenase-like predicted oxidoreductase
MQQRFLGSTGLRVSELCLGAMTFGRESDEQTSYRVLDRFVDAGGTFIDTADIYSTGESEAILGRWLKTRSRDDFVIATKFYNPMGPGPNDLGAGRKHILAAAEASLRRLGTDYIDLYQIHVYDDGTPLEETLSTLDRLVASGKVRFLGASNHAAWQLQKAIDLAHRYGWEPYVCLQPLYNLLDRGVELDLIPVCRNEGVGVIPWSPLRGGWLTGKYRREMSAPPPDTRVDRAAREGWQEQWDAYANERTWGVLDALLAVAEELERSPAQVALRWLLQRPGVTAPIIGARNLEQLDDNLGATGWSLTDEQMARLTSASDRELPYPYDVLSRVQRR